MGVRNFLFNPEIWSYLTTEFDLDIVTTVDIKDHKALGIRRCYNVSEVNGLRRIVRGLGNRIVERLAMIGIVQFHILGGDPEVLDITWSAFNKRGLGRTALLWSSLHGTLIGSVIRGVAQRLLRFHPINPVTRSRYSLIVLGHSFAPDCVAYGIAGHRRGIPVVCSPFNVDAMKHPLVFTPDLLLLWGEEEQIVFQRSQLRCFAYLSRTDVKVIGAPIHDAYRTAAPTGQVREMYGIAADERIIVYPAFPDGVVPHQYSLCEVLVEILRSADIRARIIVRIRPGSEDGEWRALAARNKEYVVLQSPQGSAYDKTGRRREFIFATERKEVDLYADTLASASLLISPVYTTMMMDSLTIGTPVIVVPVDFAGPDSPTGASAMNARWIAAQAVRFPSWRTLPVIWNRQDMEKRVLDAVSGNDPQETVPEEFLRFLVHHTDGQVGRRWIEAVSTMLERDASVSK
jgi:hypothetical protein